MGQQVREKPVTVCSPYSARALKPHSRKDFRYHEI
jgi:hypothetical protein